MIVVGDRIRNLGTLTEEQAGRIHAESLRLLSSTGLRIQSKRARDVFASGGASVKGEIVRLPHKLVECSIDMCPKEVILFGSNGKPNTLGLGRMCHTTACHRLYVLDYGARQYRSSLTEDMSKFVGLAQALRGIEAVSLMVSASEYPPPISEIKALEALVLHTDKHLYLAPQNLLEARTLLDLAEIVSDNRAPVPPVSLFASATSPLTVGSEVADILCEGVRRGAVVTVGSCAAAGATAPVTLAGTVLLQNVETLCLLTLAQLVKPGAPLIYDSGSTIADLRTGTFSLGSVEYSLITDAAMALANRYELPFSTTCDTNSSTIDVQNGLQKMLGYFTVMATGAGFSKNAGSLCNGTVMSLEQLVLDHEAILISQRFFEGMRVDEESLAADLIASIEPGGQYLTSRHTLQHCRSSERYVSPLLNMQQPNELSMLERAHQTVERLLSNATHTLNSSKQKEVRRYIRALTKQLGCAVNEKKKE